VINKSDLRNSDSIRSYMTTCPSILCSLVIGKGLDEIRRGISQKLDSGSFPYPNAVISERHRRIVVLSRKDIMEALLLLDHTPSEVALAASHLRSALEMLGEVTGRVYHEELLQSIFSRFCIGK